MINDLMSLGISKREAEELIKISQNINEDINKIKKGYPIQYAIGYVDFCGYKINVNENVLIPRYETEFLVEKVVKYCKNIFQTQINILDLCTGSGAIAIALSKLLDCNVTASDISKEAIKIASNNAKINKVNIKYIESDLFNKINDKFDVIVCNPPYIGNKNEVMEIVDKYEPKIALYAEHDGLYYYERIFLEIKKYLKEKYFLAFEIGYNQKEKLYDIAKKYFNEQNIIFEKDLSNKDRYLFVFSE